MKNVKKTLSVIFAVWFLMMPFCSASASAAVLPTVSPLYNNTSATDCSANISSTGLLSIYYNFAGYSSKTQKIVTTTYLEKKVLGLFWTRVDIGQPNNEWVDTVNGYRYTKNRTYQLSSTGTYRINIEFVAYGSGGEADHIPYQFTIKY